MCGRSYVGYETGRGPWRRGGEREFLGRDVEKMSPGARVIAALSVLAPVGLSGIFLVVFVPQLWWIFTTYFWVAFPAFGLLSSGVAGLGEGRVSEQERERELLEAIRERGEISAAAAAARTSLTVAEADRRLGELAESGHLEVRARGGAILYALWGSERRIEEVE